MSSSDFFREIQHSPVTWRQYKLHVPVFYQDFGFMLMSLLAPIDKVKSILPSTRMKPYRITPWHSVITVAMYEYRQCDIDPYNEVLIGVPVTIDEETPVFIGSLRKMPKSPMVYIHHLPVTTEIAREVGAEFAGYPKFVADIEYTEKDNWLTCELRADNQHVLTFSGRKLDMKRLPRYCIHPINYRRGYILRSEFVISERDMGNSKNGGDVKLEFGEHRIAEELRGMGLGRVLEYGYCPQAQGILTPVFESFVG